MEVRMYTDDDAFMFGNRLDKEKVCYTKETTTEGDNPVMIFRTIGDVTDLVDIQKAESPHSRTYEFAIKFLDEDGYVIEKDSFSALVLETNNDYQNRENADDLVDEYCKEQMIHYDGAEDWETRLTDAG